MVVGSVLAIAQTDGKRMLAYSSVAHAGFILTGITAANQDGIQAALFYLVAYAAMIVGAFGVVMVVSIRGEDRTGLTSYAGLARRNPLAAAFLTLFLLSLAGIPPTAGFIAKVSVFGAAVRAGHWQLVLVAVLASVIAAFFYLRVVVVLFLQEPTAAPEPVAPAAGLSVGAGAEWQRARRSPVLGFALGLAGVLTLAVGFAPQALVTAARAAGRFLG
jgi:NADH-quinone oxidoreductase subunit N